LGFTLLGVIAWARSVAIAASTSSATTTPFFA